MKKGYRVTTKLSIPKILLVPLDQQAAQRYPPRHPLVPAGQILVALQTGRLALPVVHQSSHSGTHRLARLRIEHIEIGHGVVYKPEFRQNSEARLLPRRRPVVQQTVEAVAQVASS